MFGVLPIVVRVGADIPHADVVTPDHDDVGLRLRGGLMRNQQSTDGQRRGEAMER
jgi:hypothetical protein